VAYYNGFRVNLKMLKDYPNLWGYARDLYQTPGFGDTTDFEAIKKHYHLCAISTNPLKLLPLGPEEELWNTKHGRDREYH
jgi:putative glutathione S-transferase